MQKLKINLENCYGIRDLKFEFNFQAKRSCALYAPNGFMKTSFSKTMSDFSKSKDTKDIVFPERTTVREILDETGSGINPDCIFVIEPYNEDFSSEKTSLLLVNQELKRRHDEALRKIESTKDDLIKKLKTKSGVSGRISTPETEILKLFPHNSIYDAIESFKGISETPEQEGLRGLNYAEIFNDKTIPFLESGKVKEQIKDYIEKYNNLVTASPILSKQFNHYHAKTVQKNLADNGFFAAKHSVRLFNGQNHDDIESAEDLDSRIESEKKKIFTSEALSKKFEAIDAKLKNDDLRKFRDYLFEHQEIIPLLTEFQQLQRDIWTSYILGESELLEAFLTEYALGKSIIKETIEAAKAESTEWEKVVTEFNSRFSVPFKLTIKNQAEVILQGDVPSISFEFDEGTDKREVDRKNLLSVLSQGEKRALYILNILFEINARKKNADDSLLIIDDIADSFDYKNKYAIIEFLLDVQDSGKFNSIFLSHNFDFYRTIRGRLGIPRQNCLMAFKNATSISLMQEKYRNNPFEHWKSNLSNERFLLASISFVRNLAEYCGLNPEFLKLTSLLHQKSDTATISVSNLENIYRAVVKDIPAASFPNPSKPIIDLVFEQADATLLESDISAELETKIVLSIACRLLAEKYMIDKIADPAFVSGITENQTIKLLKRFKAQYPSEASVIRILDQVNLMTPENIHLNSFMYEPILDMSPDNLKTLYRNIKTLSP